MDFIENILNSEDIIIKSNGQAKRTFCYIADAIVGYFKVLFEGEKGESYNIGNPYEEYSIEELAENLINLYPEKKINIRKK